MLQNIFAFFFVSRKELALFSGGDVDLADASAKNAIFFNVLPKCVPCDKQIGRVLNIIIISFSLRVSVYTKTVGNHDAGLDDKINYILLL